MCARLLSCPLCSQPGFVTLDALRAGLVSVATRPLACPVCDETLLGIDKLTIHLFGHTINASHRSDARKAFNIEDATRRETVSPGGTLESPGWRDAEDKEAPSSERAAREKIHTERFAFVPSLTLRDARSAVGGSSDSLSVDKSRIFAIADGIDKSGERLIFLSSRQRHCSSAVSCSDRIGTSEAIFESYRAPMIFQNTNGAERLPLVISSRNSTDCGSSRTSALHDDGPYRSNTFTESAGADIVDRKSESAEPFTETWIENLLRENSDDGSKTCAKSSPGIDANYRSEDLSNLPAEEKKYCDYPALLPSNGTNTEEKQFRLSDSTIRENVEASETRACTTLNSSSAMPSKCPVHLAKDKTERCNICGIPVPDRNILILHKQVVHMIAEKDINSKPEELLKSYPCHFCTKVFKNRGSLMVHMRIAHIGYSLALAAGSVLKDKDAELLCCENGYNCPTCGKNFRKEQHVAQHLKTHEGKQWECDVCSKMFTTKYFLKKHKRLHSGEMPYKCTLCDKTFTFQQSYHKHRLYHKDDKPHTCVTCGRSFKELSTLHNHERIHTGEKPFVCETCGKCFRQRVSYLVHRRIHTGAMPYKCVACGKNFRYKVSQRTHKCPVHGEDSGVSGSSDVAGTKTLPSSSDNDSTSIAGPNIFSRDGVSTSEIGTGENKFVLIVNSQGQPILARESDVGTNYLEETSESLKKANNFEDKNCRWNALPGDDVTTRRNVISPIAEKSAIIADNEKLSTRETNDFFSLVMSPLENDLSSPSAEMEHLRLSSPGNEDARQGEEIREVNEAAHHLQNDLSNAIEGIIRDNCTGNAPLETINEESLKQLLYGINRKA